MNKGLFQIVKSPYLTEKVSDLKQESNQYAFKVDISATCVRIPTLRSHCESVNVILNKKTHKLCYKVMLINNIKHLTVKASLYVVINGIT